MWLECRGRQDPNLGADAITDWVAARCVYESHKRHEDRFDLHLVFLGAFGGGCQSRIIAYYGKPGTVAAKCSRRLQSGNTAGRVFDLRDGSAWRSELLCRLRRCLARANTKSKVRLRAGKIPHSASRSSMLAKSVG